MYYGAMHVKTNRCLLLLVIASYDWLDVLDSYESMSLVLPKAGLEIHAS